MTRRSRYWRPRRVKVETNVYTLIALLRRSDIFCHVVLMFGQRHRRWPNINPPTDNTLTHINRVFQDRITFHSKLRIDIVLSVSWYDHKYFTSVFSWITRIWSVMSCGLWTVSLVFVWPPWQFVCYLTLAGRTLRVCQASTTGTTSSLFRRGICCSFSWWDLKWIYLWGLAKSRHTRTLPLTAISQTLA